MRTRTVLGVLLSALAVAIFLDTTAFGVQTDFKDRFAGRWDADKEKTKKYSSEREDAEKFPNEFLESMPEFRFEFVASGAATATMNKPPDGEPQTMEGDWKLIEEIDEKHAKVRIMLKVGGEEDAKEAAVEFVDEDTLAISIDEQPTLVFVRFVDESKKKDDSKSEKKDK